jgi:DNA replication protein DnaC
VVGPGAPLNTAKKRAAERIDILDRDVELVLLPLDDLGYLAFAKSGSQPLFRPISRLYERTSNTSSAHIRRRRRRDIIQH